MNKRTQAEIKKALASSLYKFKYDENENIGYVCFTVNSGTFADQKHLLSVRFNYFDGYKTCNFPTNPPEVKFITSIFHPNISNEGDICVDTLAENWSVLYSLDNIINSVIVLLDNPNPKSPYNIDANKVYSNSRKKYDSVVKEHYESKIENLYTTSNERLLEFFLNS